MCIRDRSIQGTISGLAQASASADASYQAIRSKWMGVTLTEETIAQLTEVKYRIYLRDYVNFYLYGKGKGGSIKISSTIANTLSQIRSDISDGSMLIIVSHSQGNLFAEEINSQLTDKERNLIRFVGVASVASTTPNALSLIHI